MKPKQQGVYFSSVKWRIFAEVSALPPSGPVSLVKCTQEKASLHNQSKGRCTMTKANSSEIFLPLDEQVTMTHILNTSTLAALDYWDNRFPVAVHYYRNATDPDPDGAVRHFVHAIACADDTHLPGYMPPLLVEVDVFVTTQKQTDQQCVQADVSDHDYDNQCRQCIDILQSDWAVIDPMGLITAKAGDTVASWLALSTQPKK
jgi:hypothetical protein